jgi:replication-associated recombination protein RarA
MEADWKSNVLSCVYSKLPTGASFDRLPSCEKWIASSALQKCVRRSMVELGQRAAITYLGLDRPGLWRRVISIAFEDVGAADTEALIETVAVATSADWRAKVGEEKALAYLATFG